MESTCRPIDTFGEVFAPCALDISTLSKSGDLHSLPQHTKLELLNYAPDASYYNPTKYITIVTDTLTWVAWKSPLIAATTI